MTTTDTRPVLVTGATGGQGGSVVDKALRKGIRVRALVRDPKTASARQLAEAGAEIAQGDFADAASLKRAMKSVRAVFSMQQDGAPTSDFRSLLDAAMGEGIEQFIHSTVSGLSEREADFDAYGGDVKQEYWQAKIAQERALRAAPFRYRTYLRPSLIIDNLSLRARFLYPRLATAADLLLAMPPDQPVSFVSYDTIGRIAAEAFADPARFNDSEIELADEYTSYSNVAAHLGEVSGKPVTVTYASEKDAIAMGLPPRVAHSHVWLTEVGYPARPESLAHYGIRPLPIREWINREIGNIEIGGPASGS